MEKKIASQHQSEDDDFATLIAHVKKGHKPSMIELLEFFETDIRNLANYIKMPREDAIQAIKTEFLHAIQNESSS